MLEFDIVINFIKFVMAIPDYRQNTIIVENYPKQIKYLVKKQ